MKELFSLDFSYKPDDEELSSIVNSVNEFAEKISPMFFSTEAFKICINFQDTTWTLIKESPFVEMLSNLEEDESSVDEDFSDADTCWEEDEADEFDTDSDDNHYVPTHSNWRN